MNGAKFPSGLFTRPRDFRRHLAAMRLGATAACVRLGIAVIAATLVLTSAFAPHLIAQERIEIPDEPVCTDCRIELEQVATLGDPTGPGILGDWVVIYREGRHFFVRDRTTHPGQVVVFSETGEYLRTIGRRGDGPGEFRSPERLMVAAGDSLHILDPLLGRVSVFGPDHALVRTVSFRPQFHPYSVALHPDGRYLVAAPIGTAAAIGFPLHWFELDGRLAASFGTDDPVFLPGDEEDRMVRRLHVRPDGTFYVLRLNELTIEARRRDGTMLRELLRRPSWFPPWERAGGLDPWAEPPRAYAVDVFVDDSDRMWVLAQVPSENWRPLPPERRPEYYRDQMDFLYENIIEVIDLRTHRVLARQRFPFMRGFLGGGEVYRWRDLDDGTPVWDIWSMRLVDEPGRP